VDKAFTMETEEISEVFKTDEGWNVLMVAKKRERHERTFQQVRGAVLRKLKNDRMNDLLDSYVSNLKGTTAVAIDETKLEGLTVENVRRLGGRDGLGPMLTPPGGTSKFPEIAPGMGTK
jgi:parvulin-like peptidyl-prolyl isomerase